MHGDANKGTGLHELPEGTTVADLLVRLDLPKEETYAVLRNDLPVGIDERPVSRLSDGDKVTVFPPIKGG